MALVVLPSGSTGIELQAALDNAAFGDIIQLSGDVPFSSALTVRAGLEVTIRSALGSKWTMYQFTPDTRHFEISGSLILENVIVDGRGTGGGVHLTIGAFSLQHDAIVENCAADNGGGVYIAAGVFSIYSGNVGSGLPLKGGEVRNNTAANGGGIYMSAGFLNLASSTAYISGNVATGNGGGVFVNAGTYQISGGEVKDNEAARDGGGIHVSSSAILEITGTVSSILNNKAGGNGGGIFTADSTYNNISTSRILFRCNSAASAYAPPNAAATLYPRLLFAETSITEHILNNYDVSYNTGTPIDATFKITYVSNGGAGIHEGPSIQPCETDTVLTLEATGIRRAGYTFRGWNTSADGTGDSYQPGDTVSLRNNMTLYAQWVADVRTYTVTYHPNGGAGGRIVANIPYGATHRVLNSTAAQVSLAGGTCIGWNTNPDGSGTSYVPGQVMIITDNVTLYAQWRDKKEPDDKCLFCKKFCCEFSREFSKEFSREFGCSYVNRCCEISYKISRQLCDELCGIPCTDKQC